MRSLLQRIISKTYTLPQTKLILKLLLLLFVALFAIWRGRRRAILIVGFVFFWALTAGWFSGPLLYLAQLGYERPVEPTFGPRTTLILLGGGTEYNAARRLVPKGDSSFVIDATATLYHECQRAGDVCHVIVSGGNPQRHSMAEADNYAPYLLARGVDASDLTLENQSRDTYENARNVAKILQPEPKSSLVVITPSYHMRRSIIAFQVASAAASLVGATSRPSKRPRSKLKVRWQKFAKLLTNSAFTRLRKSSTLRSMSFGCGVRFAA